MGNKIQKIYIGTSLVRQDEVNWTTQGPCPRGFHIPLSSDRLKVHNIFQTLGIGTDSSPYYLKIPAAGLRDRYTSEVVAGYLEYWASDQYNGASGKVYKKQGTTVFPTSEDTKSFGLPIRPFKNNSITPDGSRIIIYQGSGNAGIYHNSQKGLISLSSNGTDRVTIADKNLGATQVWNSGDTLSAANCGGFFQWGNNYMFPFSGSVTADGNTVDASSYGPGNYYSSSTFIMRGNTPPYGWDSSDNANLRGGVDGNVPL